MTTTRELLMETKRLVQSGWTKSVNARDASGNSVEPESPTATCWCLRGATVRAYCNVVGSYTLQPGLLGGTYQLLYRALQTRHGGRYISPIHYNDRVETTRDQVVQLLDDAIALT